MLARACKSLSRAVSFGASRVFRRAPADGAAILAYHRVTGDLAVELDLPFADFAAQLRGLASVGTVVSLDQLLRPSDGVRAGRLFVLTFDDAYEDFYTRAMPLLRRLGLPATVYVPTGFIDDPLRRPLTGAVPGQERLLPMSWDQLRELACDPLVTIGAHTHGHNELTTLTEAQVVADLEHSHERFQCELGFTPRHFAYPRGKWNGRVANIVARYYRSAATVGKPDLPQGVPPAFALARVPIYKSDGCRWFRARVDGDLDLDYRARSAVKKRIAAMRDLAS